MNGSSTAVVISGAGLVSPLGLTRELTWHAVREGRCGLGPLSAMEQPLPEGSSGGQAPDLPSDESPDQPREVRYLRRAISEALAHAGLADGLHYDPIRCGVMLGTTLHGMRAGGKFLRGRDYAVLNRFLAGATLKDAFKDVPVAGLAATCCSACSSSLGSIALGVSLLRSGRLDLVIAGGYDSISEYVYGGFNSLRLVAPGALRPFTRNRQGMKLAEGYGIVVLERAEDAAARGHRPLARILGYGESADAHHLTQPHPQGEGAAAAMNAALGASGLSCTQIDLIAAHATGTPDNDAGEYAALRRVFGDDLPRPAVVAFKSHLGHTLGGAGAVELILSALCLRDQTIPPCPNVRPEELEFPGLSVATGASRSASIGATLNTSLGFGGANTCVILGRTDAIHQPADLAAERAPRAAGPSRKLSSARPVFITGVGVVLPGIVGNGALADAVLLRDPRPFTRDTGAIPEADYVDLLNARRVRRMSDYVKLSLAATMLACRDAGIGDIPPFAAKCAAILGSAHGSANYSETYYQQIVGEGVESANPILFAEGVPNAAAAHLSLMLGLKGPCQTIIGTRTAGLDALHLASLRISAGEWDRAVVGAAEEYSPLVNAAYQEWGLHRGIDGAEGSARGLGFFAGCGAVTLILESAASIEARGGKPRARVLHTTGPVACMSAGRFSARRLLKDFGALDGILTSGNQTWIDRLEGLAIRGVNPRVVASLAGYVPEMYSVTPLAALAAAVVAGRLPRPPVNPRSPMNARSSPAPSTAVADTLSGTLAVLGADYTGLLSAASFALEPGGA